MSDWQTDPAAGGRRWGRARVGTAVVALVAAGAFVAGLAARDDGGTGQLTVDTGEEASPVDENAAPTPRTDGQGAWRDLPDSPLSPRSGHVAVWTGAEMIVWGGQGRHQSLTDGAAYDPATESWRRLPVTGSPTRPADVAAVWTGRDMVVLSRFGGLAYRPDDDAWRGVAPPPADGHWLPGSAGWTGEEVVVLADGQRRAAGYDPEAGTWRELPEPPVAGSAGAVSVELLGTLVVVGSSEHGPAITRYDPEQDVWDDAVPAPVGSSADPQAWAPRATVDPAGGRVLLAGPVRGADEQAVLRWTPVDGWQRPLDLPEPLARRTVEPVWTGEQLVAWAGAAPSGSVVNPSFTTHWRDMAPSPLSARQDATAVWTGEELLVWGGRSGDEPLGDGASFRPDDASPRPAPPEVAEGVPDLDGSWRRLPPGPLRFDEPPPGPPQATWTGEHVLVVDQWSLTKVAAYDPAGAVWRLGPRGPREQRRVAHTMVWTGTELVVVTAYGGGPARPLDGVAYDPAAGSWRDLASSPEQATGPVMATWTGREVVVLAGGEPGQPPTALGYEPATDRWRGFDTPPLANHPAALAWTGEEVLALTAGGRDHLARLDPATGGWRAGTDSPVAPHMQFRYDGPAGWTGSDWVVHGGQGGPGTDPDAAVYDPAADTWRVVDKPPQRVDAAVATGWVGHPLLVTGPEDPLDDDAPTAARLYDAGADAWRTLPPLPPWLRSVHTAVWTGEQLLVWSHGADAAVFTPRGGGAG